jgi:hypothetical protein
MSRDGFVISTITTIITCHFVIYLMVALVVILQGGKDSLLSFKPEAGELHATLEAG